MREPSAATISAVSALMADTLMRSAVIGDLICRHCVPSVVSKIVPWRPTTQHTVLVGAAPANKSDCTPLSCFSQLFPSVERKIVPESSSAQYTERSGDGTMTARTITTAETVGALALPTVASVAGATVDVGIFDPETDSPTAADLTVGVGACETVAAKTWVAGKDVLAGASRSALPPETCELRIGTEAVATGCCTSLAVLAVEVAMLEASTVGASAAAIDPSAAGDDTPAAAVDSLEGVDADAPGVTAADALTAAVGASDAPTIVGLDAVTVASDAAVDSGTTTVAFG
jgi:hypothetical protein